MDGEIREIPDAGPSETERRVLEDGGSEDGEIREILDAGHSETERDLEDGGSEDGQSVTEILDVGTVSQKLRGGAWRMESRSWTQVSQKQREGGLGCSKNTCEESVRT